MAGKRKRMTASEAYDVVSDRARKLYHIAHGRRDNSGEDYDGERLKKLSSESIDGDVDRLRESAELFKTRSISRP